MSENDQAVHETEGVKITDKRKLDPQTGEPRSTDQAPVSDEVRLSGSADPVGELTADLQRLQAEYSNYRKRVERDREVTRELTISGALYFFPSMSTFHELLPMWRFTERIVRSTFVTA